MFKSRFEKFLLFFALSVFIFFLVQILVQTGLSSSVEFSIASKWSTTLSGILAFISILLLYANIIRQSSTYFRNQIENKFYKQIEFHRDNIKQMSYRSPESKNKNTPDIITGNRVFVTIHYEIQKALEIIEFYFKEKKIEDICLPEEIKRLQKEVHIIGRKTNHINIIKINFAYLIVFFGVSKQGEKLLESIFSLKYKPSFYKEIITKFRHYAVFYSLKEKNSEGEILKDDDTKYDKYFGGHQLRLGHYFRNLYQSVKYIDSITSFSYSEKYEYIKTLRAQLSTHEQSVFLINSISQLGNIWELSQTDINKMLVTKYNLIKNIPAEFIDGVRPMDFYPLIEYEGFDTPKGRAEFVSQCK